ncbi:MULTISPECIES: enoyl-CoA hydratase-related protein [unclassified Legionella]|uniref:enoyl-CoA hydratase-related protein n=1 Tax=unclassified Legionella TaxID=2622702 RepID=UPI001055F87C|nr:enoyl-CoA hydratase-related protein [Legionella sp. W10-070]MDI9819391.1 enoyl-CoA hydratase-related protein [Legionella sp. PL877]
MSDILSDLHNNIFIVTLNRLGKHNAFDDNMLEQLQLKLEEAINHPQTRVILLKANGRNFSAGADLTWMQRMAAFSEEENLQDAMVLARVMFTLHKSPKPTIAAVHGAAFGGGAGLAAACDITIAADDAQFCFSEVKLGLIPAVISPYVVKAIGERAAKWLFMTAETFNTEKAKQLGLVQHSIEKDKLLEFSLSYAEQIVQRAPQAISDCKTLVDKISNKEIDEQLLKDTATLIAKKRVSAEGQQGLQAFLKKETPNWN